MKSCFTVRSTPSPLPLSSLPPTAHQLPFGTMCRVGPRPPSNLQRPSRSAFSLQRSAFSRSAFSVQRSAFNLPPGENSPTPLREVTGSFDEHPARPIFSRPKAEPSCGSSRYGPCAAPTTGLCAGTSSSSCAWTSGSWRNGPPTKHPRVLRAHEGADPLALRPPLQRRPQGRLLRAGAAWHLDGPRDRAHRAGDPDAGRHGHRFRTHPQHRRARRGTTWCSATSRRRWALRRQGLRGHRRGAHRRGTLRPGERHPAHARDPRGAPAGTQHRQHRGRGREARHPVPAAELTEPGAAGPRRSPEAHPRHHHQPHEQHRGGDRLRQEETKELLESYEIPCRAAGWCAPRRDWPRALDRIGYPCVSKPIGGNHGRGATIGIKTWDEAVAALERPRR